MSAPVINYQLTNYARGIVQDRTKGLASYLAPWTSTGGFASGQYIAFDDSNAFRVYNARRAKGGPTTRITFDADDPFYNCSPYGLEITHDDFEKNQVGAKDPLKVVESKIKTLLGAKALSHEYEVFTAIRAATPAMEDVGAWSTKTNGVSTADPIEEIDAAILAIARNTGMMPNRMAISLEAWAIARKNTNVLSRLSSTEPKGATAAQFSSMLINPAIDIRIGTMVMDQAKRGGEANKTNIMGNDLFVFVSEDDPSTMDPGFAKTFTSGEYGVDDVEEYRDNNASSQVYKVPWTAQIKVVGAACGKRITVS